MFVLFCFVSLNYEIPPGNFFYIGSFRVGLDKTDLLTITVTSVFSVMLTSHGLVKSGLSAIGIMCGSKEERTD